MKNLVNSRFRQTRLKVKLILFWRNVEKVVFPFSNKKKLPLKHSIFSNNAFVFSFILKITFHIVLAFEFWRQNSLLNFPIDIKIVSKIFRVNLIFWQLMRYDMMWFASSVNTHSSRLKSSINMFIYVRTKLG